MPWRLSVRGEVRRIPGRGGTDAQRRTVVVAPRCRLDLRLPDLAAVADLYLGLGTVLDGEAVVWVDGRLSFDHLQHRLARRVARSGPAGPPASYVAFDVLALDGQDQRGLI